MEEVQKNESSGFAPALGIILIVALSALGYYVAYHGMPGKVPEVVPASVEDVVPCDHWTPKVEGSETKRLYAGPGYLHRKNGQMATHCRPCEKARSKEEKFVCDGDVL